MNKDNEKVMTKNDEKNKIMKKIMTKCNGKGAEIRKGEEKDRKRIRKKGWKISDWRRSKK